MKIPAFFFFAWVSFSSNAQRTDSTVFKAEKQSGTATIILNADIHKVFPLFGAFEERKWAKGWSPVLIYPSVERIEEGTTFKTAGHGHGEKEYLWLVSRYDTSQHLIQYIVSSENRWWTIRVKCIPMPSHKTKAEITYTFIGLNDLGNELNKHFIGAIYKEDLKDWETAINNYLSGM